MNTGQSFSRDDSTCTNIKVMSLNFTAQCGSYSVINSVNT